MHSAVQAVRRGGYPGGFRCALPGEPITARGIAFVSGTRYPIRFRSIEVQQSLDAASKEGGTELLDGCSAVTRVPRCACMDKLEGRHGSDFC